MVGLLISVDTPRISVSSTGRKLVVVMNEAGKPYCDPRALPRYMTTEAVAERLGRDPGEVAGQLIRRGINPSATLVCESGNLSPLYTWNDVLELNSPNI